MFGFLRQSKPNPLPTVAELETMLRRHVLEVWFPRCVDVEYGGFLCDFDRAWQPCGAHDKLLEFQARQTWLAAEALQFAPDDERLRHAAVHGFRFLRDVMWDCSAGGWFHRMDRAGEPLEAHTKHVHGMAYAIAACVAVHTATGEAGALPLAREGFTWLEQYAHDKQYGGYFGFLKHDGTIIRDMSACPWPMATDTIDTPIGFKDGNVHSDLLQTFTYLYRVWPDPQVAERLREIVRLICDKTLISTGALFFFCQPDWTPVPHLVRYGYAFQVAHRLLAARNLIGAEEKIIALARQLVDFALHSAWDGSTGGFFYAGPASAPTQIEGDDLVVRRKSWWVQFEALKALLSLSCVVTGNEVYLCYFASQWRYLQRHLVDFQHGGVYSVGLESLPRWRRQWGARFAPADFTRKGSVWKDGSHDGRAWLYCLSVLRANALQAGMSEV
jgi:mannobiose 2-epimerase